MANSWQNWSVLCRPTVVGCVGWETGQPWRTSQGSHRAALSQRYPLTGLGIIIRSQPTGSGNADKLCKQSKRRHDKNAAWAVILLRANMNSACRPLQTYTHINAYLCVTVCEKKPLPSDDIVS